MISTTTLFLILNYLDPDIYKVLAISSLAFAFVLALSTFLTLILYFIKKIYYRWRVYIYHVLTSFRQWIFISLFFVWITFFKVIWAWLLFNWWLLVALFVFLELFIQNLEK